MKTFLLTLAWCCVVEAFTQQQRTSATTNKGRWKTDSPSRLANHDDDDNVEKEGSFNSQETSSHSKSSTMIPISLLEESLHWEDIRKPRRNWRLDDPPRADKDVGLPRRLLRRQGPEWGIHHVVATANDATTDNRHQSSSPAIRDSSTSSLDGVGATAVPVFPRTLGETAQAAVKAVIHATQQSNFEGRLAIELDGLQHLLLPIIVTRSSSSDNQWTAAGNRALALRQTALIMAQQLAATTAPVAVYFNSIPQTMSAARDYRHLVDWSENDKGASWENVTILSLGDKIPEPMRPPPPPQSKRRPKKQKVTTGKAQELYPSRGYILVVQPTDYNDEHQPPGPSIGAMEALQRLTIRATHMGLTTIVISPRFLASPHYPAVSSTSGNMPSSWYRGDGTRQLAASFGGHEPPRQPAPWLMRDFSPPVFSWIGHGMSLSPPPLSNNDDNGLALRRYTRVALYQPHVGAPWHVFGARQERKQTSATVSYDYLASTVALSGRPTREVMHQIYQEFHE